MKNKFSPEVENRLRMIEAGFRVDLWGWAKSLKMSNEDLRDFLDGRNRDEYEMSFGRWLNRVREFPSND